MFGKQWGTYQSNPVVFERGDATQVAQSYDPPANGKGGALLDGRLWREFPNLGDGPKAVAQGELF